MAQALFRASFIGVEYGAFHETRLSKKETKLREIVAQQKVILDPKLAEEKKRNTAAKIRALEEFMKTTKKA